MLIGMISITVLGSTTHLEQKRNTTVAKTEMVQAAFVKVAFPANSGFYLFANIDVGTARSNFATKLNLDKPLDVGWEFRTNGFIFKNKQTKTNLNIERYWCGTARSNC